MRKIRKKFSLSKCYGHRFNFDTHEYEDFNFEAYGNFTEKRATNFARKNFKDSTILITKVEIESQTYAISFDDFMAYSERIS